MRKFFIALLSAVCIATACLALAGCKEPEYYVLTYTEQEGVTFDFGEIKNGAEVKSGYTVNFKVTFDEDVEGTREVSLNDEKLELSESGEYSFEMKEDTSVTVNAWKAGAYKVKFDMGANENMMWYLDVDGKELNIEERNVNAGEKISFKLKVSVYCSESADDIKVTANTMVLYPDANGVYTFTVIGDTNVSVVGLQTDEDFLVRGDGAGTEKSPFIIKKPIDLYRMAYLLDDSFNMGRYSTMNCKLTEDIDLKGEKLYIIGEFPDDESMAVFCGTFDGNGHTISNYYIEDYIIDQSTGTKVQLSNIGMFGVCSATVDSPVVIKNLTLENFEMKVNGDSLVDKGFYAGGIVGRGVGVNLINCSASGTITAYGNNDYFSNVGGLIGYQQAVYENGMFNHPAYINGCSSDVEIICPAGNVLSAGGIVGILSAADEVSNAYVTDSYSTGNVSGAIYTGGIVGNLGSYSSVANCYATGEIVANSRVGLINGSDIFAKAYGGGIVGYAGGDTVISGCVFTGEVFASANQGTSFTGGIAGGKDMGDKLSFIDSRELISINNAESAGSGEEFFLGLGWSANVWQFGEGMPVLKKDANPVQVTLTVSYNGKQVSGKPEDGFNLTGYRSMAEIYQTENGMLRYVNTDDGLRSYGYFFDKECKVAVPSAYVPVSNITIYAAFADYSEVAGRYYFRTKDGSSSVYAEFDAQGNMLYRNGALNFTAVYTYDGEKITVAPSPATELSVPENGTDASTVYRVPACAQFNKGADSLVFEFKIYANNIVYSDTVTAVGTSDFVTGTYYSDTAVSEYTFYKDGSGIKAGTRFTYTVNGGRVEMAFAGQTSPEYGTIGNEGITINGALYKAYDVLKGKWEKSASTHESYTFNGKGGWVYEQIAYDEAGLSEVLKTKTGVYTLNGDTADLGEGKTLKINADGFIEITEGSFKQTYYKENSFVGKWTFTSTKNPTTIEFAGIGLDGYGEVYVSLMRGEPVTMTYETDGASYVYIYDKDVLFGRLSYSQAKGTLEGVMYVSDSAGNMSEVMFCLYDEFYGDWTCENELFKNVRFNGLGIYDIAGTSNYTRVRGTVKIGNVTVNYKLDNSLMQGKFEFGGKEYLLSYDEAADTVTLSYGTETYTLTRKA